MNDHTLDLNSKPKSRPRFFRWSLRYFLLFFTLISISSGWWITRAQKQKAAVAKIQEIGGDVEYSTSNSAEWLSDLIGVDYVQTVTKVEFRGIYENMESFDIEKLTAAVKQLSSCRSLSLQLRGITDEQLVKLQPLSGQLEEISLREVSYDLSAAGIKAFENWPKLKLLDYDCSGGDPDFSALLTCPQLESIKFSSLYLKKDDFQKLASCRNLKFISLWRCSFQGELLRELNKPNVKLEGLSLMDCYPVPFVGSWTINKAGERIDLEPMSFNFQSGSPKFRYPQRHIPGDKDFPNEEYEKWKKEILPRVDVGFSESMG